MAVNLKKIIQLNKKEKKLKESTELDEVVVNKDEFKKSKEAEIEDTRNDEDDGSKVGSDYWGKFKQRIIDFQTVSLKDKIFFIQNLRVMVKGGLSLGRALDSIASQVSNSYFKKVLTGVSLNVQSGTGFAKSLEAYPKVFDDLFINMVKSGELSGNLEDVLDKLHIQLKRDHDLLSKVKGAMIYPAVVLVAMFGIGAAMMVLVVPKLITVFEEFDAALPVATRVLISVSRFITNNGILVLVGLVVFLVVFIKYYRSKAGIKVFHKIFLKLPVLSGIVKKINLARFCRTTSSLLKTDIAIVKSLEITSMVVGNYYYKRALEDAAKKITKGLQINKVLSAYPKLFSPTVLQMLKVGEESGSVDVTLDEVAQFYEEEVNQIMETLPSIIEPVLILFLGVGVGAMAVAIIMPMYSLGQSF